MKNALISPNEFAYSYNGTFLGERVAEVATEVFPVAPPLFWTPCADDVVADRWYYDPVTLEILEAPQPPPDNP
jgi:hypothetical protein